MSSPHKIGSQGEVCIPHQVGAGVTSAARSCLTDLDVTKRDRFELLSAYLDGEVTPDESRLVAQWLSEDAETQCLYRRLLTLRQAMRSMPIVATSASPATMVELPTSQISSRLTQRIRTVSLAAACTVAMVLIGGLANLVGSEAVSSKLTWLLPEPLSPTSDPLELALDEPVIDLLVPEADNP